MGLFSRLFGRKTTTVTIERIIDSYTNQNVTGNTVNESTALSVATVYACSRIICEAVGQTPLLYYKRDRDGFLDEDFSNPLHYLMSIAPNDMESAATFFENIVHNQLFSGKAFTVVTQAAGGKVLEFLPINPHRVRIVRDMSGVPIKFYLQQPGKSEREIPKDLLIYHKAYRELSLLQAAKNSMGLIMQAEKHEGNVLKKGAKVKGILKLMGRHDPEELVRRGKDFDAAFGGDNSEQTVAIGVDEDYKPISMSNSDLQLVDGKKLSQAEICAAFRVPLYMVTGENAPSDMESEARRFYIQCLGPIFHRLELDFKKYLIESNISKLNKFDLKFNTSKYLEADAKTVAYVNDTYIKNGVRSPNEIRQSLNLKPREDGKGDAFVDISEINTGLVTTSGTATPGTAPPGTSPVPENEGTLNGNE